MEQRDLVADAQFIGQVAVEAVDESDAIERHPEIVDMLAALSREPSLPQLFSSNGHDPVAFVLAVAEGLAPYREAPLEESPELVTGLAMIAQALRQDSPRD